MLSMRHRIVLWFRAGQVRAARRELAEIRRDLEILRRHEADAERELRDSEFGLDLAERRIADSSTHTGA